MEQAQEYRLETLKFVENRLGLDALGTSVTTTNAVIKSFDVIGDALREDCTIGKQMLSQDKRSKPEPLPRTEKNIHE